MIHKQMSGIPTYNVPVDTFRRTAPKFGLVSHGNYLIDGFLGPETGSSIHPMKLTAMRLATAEAVERRCSMLGVAPGDEPTVRGWNILNHEVSWVDARFTRLRSDYPYVIDTTGTAAHTTSEIAIGTALKELLEKNALFMLWYGQVGARVPCHLYSDNYYFRLFSYSGWNVSVIMNDYFLPLLVVVVFLHRADGPLLCGVGSSLKISNALIHAFREAYLIGAMGLYSLRNGQSDLRPEVASPSELKHIEGLNQLEMYPDFPEGHEALSLECVARCVPEFVEDLHAVFLRQFLVPPLKCVRVLSQDLFTCLPQKKNLDLNRAINRKTINVSYQDISLIPDCPMN